MRSLKHATSFLTSGATSSARRPTSSSRSTNSEVRMGLTKTILFGDDPAPTATLRALWRPRLNASLRIRIRSRRGAETERAKAHYWDPIWPTAVAAVMSELGIKAISSTEGTLRPHSLAGGCPRIKSQFDVNCISIMNSGYFPLCSCAQTGFSRAACCLRMATGEVSSKSAATTVYPLVLPLAKKQFFMSLMSPSRPGRHSGRHSVAHRKSNGSFRL